MVTGTAAAITVVARVLSPVISDLYKSAKDGAAKGLKRWKESTFPRRLAKRIDAIGQVKTLWSPDDDVSLLNFYYPPNLSSHDRGAKKSIESVRDIDEGNLVIQGIVGQGKSIFLRWLAIKEAIASGPNRIPIFLELRMLQPSLSLIPAIYRTLASFDIDVDDETFDHLAKSGRFVLLLDAFDELDEALTKSTLNDIAFLNQRYPELQIIVTSRPGNEIQKTSGFRVVRISPLTRQDYGPFLTKLGLSAVKIHAIREAIKESPSKLAELITTPLMLTLVVIVYESEKEIPPTLPEFFERLFQVVFTRHDRLKAGFNRKRHSGLSERRLQSLFEAFCFMVLQSGFGRSLTSSQFSSAFDIALEYAEDCKCEEEKFRLDIVKVACLMLEEGIDSTTFLHKSVLEYYAAAFIKHSTDEVARLFYKATDQSPRIWQEVIRFLSDIDPYRYSKDFAIGQLAMTREEFIAPMSCRTVASLLTTIRSIHPSIGVDYRQNDDDQGQFRLSSYGPFSGKPRLIYEEFDDLLVDAVGAVLPRYVSRFELEAMLGRALENEEVTGEINIPLHRIVEYGDTSEFWKAVDIFTARLERMEAEAKAVIAQQEKRKLIFERREKKPT